MSAAAAVTLAVLHLTVLTTITAADGAPLPVRQGPAAAPAPPPPPAPTPRASDATVIPDVWGALADCESGDRDVDGRPVAGTARWWWGDPDRDHPSWGSMLHSGGLQWTEQTWAWLAPEVLGDDPPAPWQATPAEEVAVAERYVEIERAEGRGGFGPWPTCGRMLGLMDGEV